jgi:hypothetical protein
MTLEKQEIRILQPKISDEKTDSFFYHNSGIAHAIRPDGTAILLIAEGDIRIELYNEVYDNKTKETAIEKYELTDKKLKDLEKDGVLIWKNNNWFEIIYTRDGMKCWELVNNSVVYDYDKAIKNFKDCYNRTDLINIQKAE